MARYIDADELLNKLPDDLPYKASVKRVLMQAEAVEVAREIFEEIDNYLDIFIEREYSFAEEEYSKGHYPEAEAHDYAKDTIEDIRHFCVAELKKKYEAEASQK